jgi:hypothetical protein
MLHNKNSANTSLNPTGSLRSRRVSLLLAIYQAITMHKFYTIWYPERIKLGCISSSADETPIWLGSSFHGLPSKSVDWFEPVSPLNRLLLLDVNILSFIRERNNIANIRALFAWAATEGLVVTPIIAVAEQHRTHGAPDRAFKRYVDALRKDYCYDLPLQEVDRLLKVFSDYSPATAQAVDLLARYYVLIKHFYHKKWSAKKKKRFT